ncbi:MAG TPA: M50 family metallopeptidase [Candidatus Paceibacterota bacterium]|nr:M50 family metallopeptidase [Candidatus Paceibacterota bacterium]
MTALLVILILVVLIVGHELGHFVAAKLLGVRVVEFGIGYPPRAFKLGRWGGTEYTINWLPFGGFVRLYGEEHEHEELKGRQRWHSIMSAPLWAQAAILVAGVAMNVAIGWGLYVAGFMNGLPTSVAEGTPGAHLVVNGVLPGSPADAAGFETGDEIIAVTDASGSSLLTLTPSAMVAYVEDHGGQKIDITYIRKDATSTVPVIPAHAVLADQSGRPALGVALALVSETHIDFWGALREASLRTGDILSQVGSGILGLLHDALFWHADLSEVVGPVGLISIVDQTAGYGAGQILGLAAFISLNLAIVNLIPIPAFDGGRLLFVAYEALTRRRIPSLVAQTLNLIGFALIIVLMVVVTYHDIVHLLG